MRRLAPIFFIIFIMAGCSSMPRTPAEKYQGYTAKRLITKAEKNISKGYYDEASEQLEALKSLHPFSRYARQAQLDLIYSHYKEGSYEEAIASANRYLKLYPRSKHSDYAYYMKGLVNFERTTTTIQEVLMVDPATLELGFMDAAFNDFNKLVTLYPDSIYSWDARYRMVYIRNLMARHELQVSRFYLDNHMYVAAVNRAADVLMHFQGTSQVKPAVWVMKRGYQELGFEDLANDTKKLYYKLS